MNPDKWKYWQYGEDIPDTVDLGLGQVIHKCKDCDGTGVDPALRRKRVVENSCVQCDGRGWSWFDPSLPTTCMPGTVGKTTMLQLRIMEGLELWHPQDGMEEKEILSQGIVKTGPAKKDIEEMAEDSEFENYEKWANGKRQQWRDKQVERCALCGSIGSSLDIHEIERRSHAAGRWTVESNFLLLCRKCHDGPMSCATHARQLAVKLISDATHFDLNSWLQIRDPELKAPKRVTFADIAKHLQLKG